MATKRKLLRDALIKRLCCKSPQTLYELAKRKLLRSDAFEARFPENIEAMPTAIKRDVLAALFSGARPRAAGDELPEWQEVTPAVLKRLLFSEDHNFAGENGRAEFVWKVRCAGCGRAAGARRALPTVTECEECGNHIEHDHPRLENDELHELVFDFANWCQNCCVCPLFDIRYTEDGCVQCAMEEEGYSSKFAERLCAKYNLAPVFNRCGVRGIEQLIESGIEKLIENKVLTFK
ncbi:hypothetical protein [Samia ricini nucleopolyhedrovirus]|nr:hypothetical protein [Philosamia cynthia ricini nucleopolyhedrovirus virus]BBD51100.1 hypothetical protein [Samia ricini nucleopolyhedrovirus]BBD51252.1 hypothetical protein [Samia ricini nucleopolyhedrovirus]BBD51404.1 hypothetical protein [Samia ricini nucleopolyhedrovirus]